MKHDYHTLFFHLLLCYFSSKRDMIYRNCKELCYFHVREIPDGIFWEDLLSENKL